MAQTQQVAVRIPVELVEFADSVVSEGGAVSRAAFVVRALAHERQRVLDERDAAIYDELARNADPAEEAAWAHWAEANANELWRDLDA